MEPARCRRLFGPARVARLATVGAGGPHLVPVVFTLDDDHIYTAVDHKPKASRRLQRLINIEAVPKVSLLVDHYDDDWEQLWWVRADGVARIVDDLESVAPAVELLTAKYSQYRHHLPAGPLIDIAVTSWTGWSAG